MEPGGRYVYSDVFRAPSAAKVKVVGVEGGEIGSKGEQFYLLAH